jgi:hypothetical protein
LPSTGPETIAVFAYSLLGFPDTKHAAEICRTDSVDGVFGESVGSDDERAWLEA